MIVVVGEMQGCLVCQCNMKTVCCVGSSRKLLHHDVAKITASDNPVFEDSHQVVPEMSSLAAANVLPPRDQHVPRREDTMLSDSSWQDDEQFDMNYTLASDVDVSEAGPWEAATSATSHDGVVDATADVTKFPSKNDL